MFLVTCHELSFMPSRASFNSHKRAVKDAENKGKENIVVRSQGRYAQSTVITGASTSTVASKLPLPPQPLLVKNAPQTSFLRCEIDGFVNTPSPGEDPPPKPKTQVTACHYEKIFSSNFLSRLQKPFRSSSRPCHISWI
jgi:hypothetical protein